MNAGCGRCQRIARSLVGVAVWLAVMGGPPSASAYSWKSWLGDDRALGGSGTWNNDSMNTNWIIESSSAISPWVTGDQAKFTGTGGVVTVEGTVTFHNRIYFVTNGYVVTGGTIASDADFAISVANGATATVYSTLSMPAGMGFTTRNDVGNGTLILNADLITNNFNGDITLYAGTLVLNGDNYSVGGVKQTGNGQYAAFFLNSTHHKAGPYTIYNDGTFGGTGTVQMASVSNKVSMSGKLIPGTATEIGTLTIGVGKLQMSTNTTAEFQIDLAANKADKVVVGDLLTYAGTLNLRFAGSRVTPASYQLFQFGSKAGNFNTTNVFGLNPSKATVSYNPATGILAYIPIVAKGALILVR